MTSPLQCGFDHKNYTPLQIKIFIEKFERNFKKLSEKGFEIVNSTSGHVKNSSSKMK
jgi:hypothetical protein